MWRCRAGREHRSDLPRPRGGEPTTAGGRGQSATGARPQRRGADASTRAGRGGRLPAASRHTGDSASWSAGELDAVELAQAPGVATETTAVTGRHLPALNGLRGVAVLGVVASTCSSGGPRGATSGWTSSSCCPASSSSTLLLEDVEPLRAGSTSASVLGPRAKRLLPALCSSWSRALTLYLIFNVDLRGAGGQRAGGSVRAPGRRHLDVALRQNWHSHLRPPVLLRPVLDALAAAAHLVAGDRGAVLPGLAAWCSFCSFVWPAGAWREDGDDHSRSTLGVLSGRPHGRCSSTPGSTPRGSITAPTPASSISWPGPPSPSWPRLAPQPDRRSRRMLHRTGPMAAIALAVFWVTAGTPGGLPRNFMFEGGFLLCAGLAALVVADARLRAAGPVWSPAGCPPAALPRDHLLRHLPLALAGDRLRQRATERVSPSGRSTCSGWCSHWRSRPPATTWWSDQSGWPTSARLAALDWRRRLASPRPSSWWWPRSRRSPTRPRSSEPRT